MSDRLTDISVQLHQETPRATLVSDDGDFEKAVWLPKSQVEYVEKAGSSVIEVTLPEWLATERGLV